MHKRIDFQPGQTLLFIGNSITDCERREPPYGPLGCGYVNFAANFLLAARPDLNLTIENRGISGDTTSELLARWDQDCLALKPDVVSIMIGINDLWRKFSDCLERQQLHVVPDDYESNYRQILTQLSNECESQVILMEPFMFCDEPDNPMLAELPSYIETVHKLAGEFNAVLVPIHTNYMKLTGRRPADQWAEDTVHPTTWAHAWIARQWLEAVAGTN